MLIAVGVKRKRQANYLLAYAEHLQTEKDKARRYLANECETASRYMEEFPENSPIIRLKLDKIQGITECLNMLDILSWEEIRAIKSKYIK